MEKLTIDNLAVEVPDGSTILDAARAAGIDIPTLCHYPPLGPGVTCMVCLVRVEGVGGFVPSCATRARDGMIVESQTPEVLEARRRALELLLSDHVGDCQAPCQALCPAGLNIPLMTRQIAGGRLAEALETVHRRIALAAVLGRVCPAPCEKGCRRGQHDAAVSICLLKRFVADTGLAGAQGPPVPPETGKGVAVVGAGPAGLSAAFYLRRQGHAVTVFDRGAAPGGGLRDAFAQHGLPADALEAEIQMIRGMGAAFRQGVRVGADVALETLCKEFDAVLLATGAPAAAADLGVETAGGFLAADRQTYVTKRPNVFAAGAAIRKTAKLAVRACADGREAAGSIGRFLAAAAPAAQTRRLSVHMGRLHEGEMAGFLASAGADARVRPSGADGGLSADEAAAEARRCLHCDCRKGGSCRLRREAEKYQADLHRFRCQRRSFEQDLAHPDVIYEPGKCIFCGTCVRILRHGGDALGLTYVGRGFDMRLAVPFGESLAVALGRLAGECVAACPTAALAFRDERRCEYDV